MQDLWHFSRVCLHAIGVARLVEFFLSGPALLMRQRLARPGCSAFCMCQQMLTKVAVEHAVEMQSYA